MTLNDFILRCGGPVAAAKKVGTSYRTIHRWTVGKAKPRGMYAQRLKKLGVTL